MKYFAIFLFVLIGIVSADFSVEDLQKFQNAIKGCRKSTQIDTSLLKAAKKGKLVNDPAFGCYMDCLARGVDLMGPDGNWDIDGSAKRLPKNYPNREAFLEAGRVCANIKSASDDACETGHIRYVCLLDQGFPPTFV